MKIHSKIRIPVALAEAGGVLQDFVWNSIVRGHERVFGNDIVELHGLNPNEQPTFSELTAIVQNGGSFEGIRLGLQFTALAANRDVPAGVPGSTITPEGEETRQKTWSEWITSNTQQLYRHTNGSYFVMKGALNGDLLNSEQLDAARSTSGVSVIEIEDHNGRIASENYEPFEL